MAYHWLARSETLPEFAVRQLRTLLETIWVEERQNLLGVEFAPQRVLVSAQGGNVLRGGARLELIIPTMQNLLFLPAPHGRIPASHTIPLARAPVRLHQEPIPTLGITDRAR